MACEALRRGTGLVFVCVLLSCGGGAPERVGFVNETHHTDAALWSLWRSAQAELSQEIDLNPLQRELTGTSPELRPGDPGVWSILPRQLVVAAEPDILSVQLYSATGQERSDPTGLLACPQPCNVRYTAAYSHYSKPVVRYAASWEATESSFDYLVEYEFENQILHALGYDTSRR